VARSRRSEIKSDRGSLRFTDDSRSLIYEGVEQQGFRNRPAPAPQNVAVVIDMPTAEFVIVRDP
jgi:hypothetical protein